MEVSGSEYTIEEAGSARTAYDFSPPVASTEKKKGPRVPDWTPPPSSLAFAADGAAMPAEMAALLHICSSL
jgi:hypothetical protein